ncbi:MAG TPA: hypothetical protein VHW90_06100 [Stellaceae bacterium]|jgi:uncharacterized protein YcfJ|nr:hypothetical protein [Stellaceae bacterium]
MNGLSIKLVGAAAVVLATSSGAMAQYYANDASCRQYADQQTAPMRAQANANTVGSTIVGAGLGAALGGALGGGRGAGIGAASGAIVGAGNGAAQAQYSADYIQQQYNAYYYQCMNPRPQPAYPPQGYPPQGYAPQPGYYPGYQR